MTQTKLTDTQITLLARGAGHADGFLLPPDATGKAAAAFGAPLGALRRKGLAGRIRTAPGAAPKAAGSRRRRCRLAPRT